MGSFSFLGVFSGATTDRTATVPSTKAQASEIVVEVRHAHRA